MPANYQYIDKTTGEAAMLPDVDDAMCKFMGTTPDPENYKYQHMVGFIATMQLYTSGGFELDEAGVEAIIAKIKPDKDTDEKYLEMLREFLIRRYTFKAWRGM